jgi:hypothetical protein
MQQCRSANVRARQSAASQNSRRTRSRSTTCRPPIAAPPACARSGCAPWPTDGRTRGSSPAAPAGKPRSAHHPRSARHARWQRLPGAVREPRELVVHIPAIITKPTIDLESFRSRKVGQSRFSWPLTPDDRERVLAARTGGSSSPVTYGAWSIGASPRMAAWSGCVIMLCWCMADSESRAIGTGSSSISPSRSCIPETPLQLRRIREERKATASRLHLPSLLAGPTRRPREPRPAWADRVEAPTSVWPGSGGAGRLLCWLSLARARRPASVSST